MATSDYDGVGANTVIIRCTRFIRLLEPESIETVDPSTNQGFRFRFHYTCPECGAHRFIRKFWTDDQPPAPAECGNWHEAPEIDGIG